LVLNYYGPSILTTKLKPGLSVILAQETEYLLDAKIVIRVKPSKTCVFTLKLRIPHWSTKTKVSVNEEVIPVLKAGNYLKIDRKWEAGDKIYVTLDMHFYLWRGEQECEGLASIHRGPILLAYDHRCNLVHAKKGKPEIRDIETWHPVSCRLNIPPIDAKRMQSRRVQ